MNDGASPIGIQRERVLLTELLGLLLLLWPFNSLIPCIKLLTPFTLSSRPHKSACCGLRPDSTLLSFSTTKNSRFRRRLSSAVTMARQRATIARTKVLDLVIIVIGMLLCEGGCEGLMLDLIGPMNLDRGLTIWNNGS
jgi:hypothetical protein